MADSTADARLRLIATNASSRLSAFARDVREGLTSDPKRLSCCYFYDGEGSLLFEHICELPEYYLTGAEREILEQYSTELTERFSTMSSLVELGSGNAAKTRILIEAFLRCRGSLRYVPIDICRVMLEDSSLQLLRDYSRLEILALAAEYHEGLRHLQTEVGGSKLILWLGSNIGNFERADAVHFLREVRHTMTARDGLLVGIDLRKDRATLERAYDDAQGMTAEFNLNLLVRINRELGGRFDLDAFEHRAVYNDELGRIEMYLISRRPQHVKIDHLGLVVPFTAGEAIHTENSYKYSDKEIADLTAASGLRIERQWFDGLGRFSENLLVPACSSYATRGRD